MRFLNNLKVIKSSHLTIILSVYFIAALNFVLVKKLYDILLEAQDLGFLFYITVPIFFVASFIIIFTPFVTKYITKPFFITLILASSAVNYTTYNFGLTFNQDMLVNIFETTPTEATSYANISVFVWLFLTGFLPALYLAFVKIEYRPFVKEIISKIILIVGAASMIGIIALFFYKDYASLSRNNPKIAKDIIPTYFIGSTYKYIKATYFTTPLPYVELGTDAVREIEEEKYLVVFLVGETARAQNYPYNGYNRSTTAHTDKIDNIFSFKDVSSCGTATAVSLPCMFSFLGKAEYSKEKFDAQDNVVDVLKRAGIKTLWLDNNTGCKGVCDNIESYGADEFASLECKDEGCTDSVFIDVLDEKVKKLNGQDATLFFHLVGSHGPTYFKRYPKEHGKFLPDCQTSDLQKCSDVEIINSYDNTILYTDYVMAQVIEKLKKYDDIYHLAVIYVSDHGESLGENGLYLHGMPYSIAPAEQTHVPFMMWMSDKMIQHKKIDMTCLKNKAGQKNKHSHDNISPTLLNLMDIDTEAYNPDKDLLRECSGK